MDELLIALRAVNTNLCWIAMTLIAILVVLILKDMGGKR